jgi:hypothetical protein
MIERSVHIADLDCDWYAFPPLFNLQHANRRCDPPAPDDVSVEQIRQPQEAGNPSTSRPRSARSNAPSGSSSISRHG